MDASVLAARCSAMWRARPTERNFSMIDFPAPAARKPGAPAAGDIVDSSRGRGNSTVSAQCGQLQLNRFSGRERNVWTPSMPGTRRRVCQRRCDAWIPLRDRLHQHRFPAASSEVLGSRVVRTWSEITAVCPTPCCRRNSRACPAKATSNIDALASFWRERNQRAGDTGRHFDGVSHGYLPTGRRHFDVPRR